MDQSYFDRLDLYVNVVLEQYNMDYVSDNYNQIREEYYTHKEEENKCLF